MLRSRFYAASRRKNHVICFALFIIIIQLFIVYKISNSLVEAESEVIPSSVTIRYENKNAEITFDTGEIKIGIVIVVTGTNTLEYSRGLESITCYSRIHRYTLLVINHDDYNAVCHQNHVYFRRHCIVSHLLSQFDYLMMLDADIGVLNPKRKIEEFIRPEYDITFYDRFYNDEIAIGSYIVKNTPYSRDFLMGFADCESLLPNSFHGTENGILHKYVASKLFPGRPEVYEPCIQVYNNSKTTDHLFAYEACIRAILGAHETFTHIRIMRKGTGWVRDSWLANSMWNPKHDFMFHGLKSGYLVRYRRFHLPFRPTHYNRTRWIDPYIGPFNLERCYPGNSTWNYDKNLISTTGEIERALKNYEKELQKEHYRLLALVTNFL